MFHFYFSTIKVISMVLFYTLIGLLISILIVNNKLLDTVNKNDNKKFQENLKIQKGLIWTNYAIITLLFLYLLSVSFYFFTSRFTGIYNVTNQRRSLLYSNIILSCLILIFTGLTYYINKSLNEINIMNAKEELKKIYIIVPLISIISICLLMYNFSKSDSLLMYINNHLTYYQFQDLPSVTRNSSPTRLNTDDEEDVPIYFRDDFSDRYRPTPSYLNYEGNGDDF